MSQTKAQLLDGKSATIQFTGGSASAPSVSFTGDTNTGIYSPGADQVAISTGGTRRLIIFSDGKVGLGAASVLQQGSGVDGGSGAGILELYNGGTGNTTLENTGAFPILFKTSGTERLRITSAGLVGIGTSSPSQLLTTVGNIKIAGAQASNNAKLCLTRTDRSWSINNETDLRFYNGSGDTDSPPTASVVFSSSGNVGIGTTSPSATLQVSPSSGSANFQVSRGSKGL
ncbi:hypothetical protein EBT25_03115 [bacterium]|nr:hypothetical protein [bacterium]